MTQIQSVISRVFDSVSKPGLSNGFHVWELRGEADLGGFALSESSWQRRKDSWKPEQHGVTPTAPWLRSTRTPWTNFLLEVRASDLGFLQPGNESHFIHPSIRRRVPHPQLPESLKCSNFNLSTQLFNKGVAELQTQVPSCSLHAVGNRAHYWLNIAAIPDWNLFTKLICDVMKQWCTSCALEFNFSNDSDSDCDGNDYLLPLKDLDAFVFNSAACACIWFIIQSSYTAIFFSWPKYNFVNSAA